MFITQIFILSLSSFGADLKASLIQSPPTQVFKFEVVEFRPIKGHHFELKAPNECSPGVVVSLEKDVVQCQFSDLGSAKASLNICDDKKTYCKPSEATFQVVPAPAGIEQKPLSETLLSMKEDLHDQLLPDFISGTPDDIKAKSEKSGKPVFVMISTDWCPPCNQSKEYLLSTKEFQEMTKDWIKVYVDGDSKASRQWSSYVPFNAYPTMALLNSNLEEVSRFQMEFTQNEFKAWMERVQPFTSESYEEVQKRVLARKEGRLLQRIVDFLWWVSEEEKKSEQNFSIETALAKNDLQLLEKMESEDVPEFLQYDWHRALKDKILASGMLEVDYILKSMDVAGTKPSYFAHVSELCELDKKACPKLNREALEVFSDRVESLKKSSNRTEAEKLGALSDEYYAQMSFFKDQNYMDAARSAAKKCVESFEKMISASKLKNPRYAEQGIIACARTYDLNRVDALYKKMMTTYPEDPTFVSRYVRFLKEDKKDLKRARVFAKRALELSYDYNWFFAATTKVQIDQALGLKAEAKQTISEAFARLDLDQDKSSIDQRIASRFRKLEQSL